MKPWPFIDLLVEIEQSCAKHGYKLWQHPNGLSFFQVFDSYGKMTPAQVFIVLPINAEEKDFQPTELVDPRQIQDYLDSRKS